jgi:hypothetical protein
VKALVIAIAVAACGSAATAQSLPGGFVFLHDIDPSIIQDLRYAGHDLGKPGQFLDQALLTVGTERQQFRQPAARRLQGG